MAREIVYSGRDNTVDLVLVADKLPVDITPITRVTIDVGGTIVDSDATPGAFVWPVDRELDGRPVKALLLKLGGVGLATGDYRAELVVYDTDHPAGLVWTERLPLTVV